MSAQLEDFRRAQQRIATDAIHTPLLPALPASDGRTVRLKAECLQPLGSFKIRCAANALGGIAAEALQGGVATASAGNFAQGLGLAARRRGVALTAHVPQNAAAIKIDALRSLGVTVVPHAFAEWWAIMSSRNTGAADGVFIHPVCERDVILGNGTLGIELAEDWAELDTVVVPYGGGGLACGIALAFRALSRSVRVIACEIETAPALQAARLAGAPIPITRQPSFVDGIGSNGVLEQMWPLARELIDDVVVVSVAQARAAVRELAIRHHLIVEGAGAVAYAAAMSARSGGRNVAAILSGGNIDPGQFCTILTGH